MVYLKGIFVATAKVAGIVGILLIMLCCAEEAEGLKIAYKKPICDKTNSLKEQESTKLVMHLNNKVEIAGSTAAAPTTNVDRTDQADNALFTTTPMSSETESAERLQTEATNGRGIAVDSELPQKATEDITTLTASSVEQRVAALLETTNHTTFVKIPPRLPSSVGHNGLVPCTCGVFLSSQFKRGTGEQPNSEPVIVNELDRTYPCNAFGRKQCQTKCLETLVQHLPNSANILCATLERDCRKERAYLFIKNCRNQWYETNLAAGREYCCRKGKSYPCPMI